MIRSSHALVCELGRARGSGRLAAIAFALAVCGCGSSSKSTNDSGITDSAAHDSTTTAPADTTSPANDATVTPPGTANAIGYASCPAPTGSGVTYTIGMLDSTNKPTGPQTIAAFTHWNDLAAGDVVCIYGQAAPYAERLVLTRGGTDDGHRVRIVGVVQGGNEPIVTGKSATTADAFNYGANISQNWEGGEVSILGHDAVVAYLNIEGLTIQGATTAEVAGTAAKPTYSVNTYADPNINGGAQTAWGCGAAGVNIIHGDHISLVHNRIKDNDNGIFVNSNNGNTSSSIVIQSNFIYGNGVYGEQQGAWNPGKCGLDAHGTYSEASGITYLGNRFGAPKQGEPTNLLKDRSSGLVVAYNLFLPDGALEATLGDSVLVGASPQGFGHELDLVESYDASVGLNTIGAAYDNVNVFGNVFFDDSAGANSDAGTTVPLHFGGDQGNPTVYRHHLHFYNNTVVARRDSSTAASTLEWFEMETNTNAEAWNNIFYAAANTTTTPQGFALLGTYCYNSPCGTTSYLTQNWVSPLWGTTGVNGTATTPSFVGLATNDVHIASSDPTIVGNGQAGDASYPANATTIPIEYADFLGTVARPYTKATIDLGAFGYSGP